jgi:hypothetical protein
LAARLTSAALGSFLGKAADLRLKVDEAAVVEAGRLDLVAKETISARSEGLDLKASGSVAIDGRHLRLG